MKIEQDPENGQILIKLGQNEKFNNEELLEALFDFVSKQAIEVYRLRNSYRKIVGRLNELDLKSSKIEKVD